MPLHDVEHRDARLVGPVQVVDEEHGIAGRRDNTVGDLVVRAAQCLSQRPLERQVGTPDKGPERAPFEMRDSGEGESQQRGLSDSCAPDHGRQPRARNRLGERREFAITTDEALHVCFTAPVPPTPEDAERPYTSGGAPGRSVTGNFAFRA